MSTTANEITRNLSTILEKEGLALHHGTGHLPHTPGRSPAGRVLYLGEDFQPTHGERPGYAVAEFRLEVVLRERATDEPVVALQDWIHRIRDCVSPSSLNVGSLSATRPVVRVDTKGVRVEEKEGWWRVMYGLAIRYRENP